MFHLKHMDDAKLALYKHFLCK